jgi:heat shock protein HslJ
VFVFLATEKIQSINKQGETMRKIRSSVFIILTILAASITACSTTPPTPLPGAGTGTSVTSADQITGILWKWNDVILKAQNQTVTAPNPENYTITFNPDGTVKVKADCNIVTGDYVLANGSLTIHLGPGTLAACSPDSLETQYRLLLNTSSQGAIQPDGQLYLYLTANSGRMSFTNGGPASK